MWDQILGFDPTTYDNVRAWPAFVGDGEAVYIVSGMGGEETEELGRLEIEAVGSEVRISDAGTGDILAVVDTGESSFSASALVDSFEGFRTTQLGVVDWPTGTVELLDTPWGDDVQQIDIVPTARGLAVYALRFTGEERTLSFEQYSTRDGVDWVGPSQPLFLEPPEPGDVSVDLRNGVLLAGVRNEARGRFYTSDEGVEWTSLDAPYSEGEVMPFDLGYVAWDFRNHLSVSRDGVEWVEIDTSSISIDQIEDIAISFNTAVGDSIFTVATGHRGSRDVWVVQFDG